MATWRQGKYEGERTPRPQKVRYHRTRVSPLPLPRWTPGLLLRLLLRLPLRLPLRLVLCLVLAAVEAASVTCVRRCRNGHAHLKGGRRRGEVGGRNGGRRGDVGASMEGKDQGK